MPRFLRHILSHRDVILAKAGADLRAEARRYYISYLWWFIEPTVDMAIFYFVFGVVMGSGGPDYVPFLLTGLTAWKWFGTTVQHSMLSLVQGKGLMLQLALPKVFFPSVVVLTDTFKFAIVFGILLVVLWSTGFPPTAAYLHLPLLMATELGLILAAAFLTAAVVPFFPDLAIVLTHVLQVLFFVSGIFFDVTTVSPQIRTLLHYNPMILVIHGYRQILMRGEPPEAGPLWIILGLSVAVWAAGGYLLTRWDKLYPRLMR